MQITRRAALGGALSFGAAGSATAAVSILEPEHPVKRLHKLAVQASQLMPAYDEQMGSPWELHVRAPSSDGKPYVFYSDIFPLPRSVQIKQHLFALKQLCEAETGYAWMVIACADARFGGISGILHVRGDDCIHDPYGLMGKRILDGVEVGAGS